MSFIYHDERIYLNDSTVTFEKLKPTVYLLQKEKNSDVYYLIEKDKFKLPPKIYGDHSIINRWIKSFNNTSKNLGIALTGLKGTGKTITAQMLCNQINLPVFLVESAYAGTAFSEFLAHKSIGRCVVFIDEFEKIYPKDYQEALLPLLDGNHSTNVMFLLTMNNKNLNEYLINRLNRLKYLKNYDTLENDIIHEVIDDMLEKPEHKQSIIELFLRLGICTFDLLVNIIKEVNLFNESALDCAKHLNLEVLDARYTTFIGEHNGEESLSGTYYIDVFDNGDIEVFNKINKVGMFKNDFNYNAKEFLKFIMGDNGANYDKRENNNIESLSGIVDNDELMELEFHEELDDENYKDTPLKSKDQYPFEDEYRIQLKKKDYTYVRNNDNSLTIFPKDKNKYSFKYIRLVPSKPLYYSPYA